jgi:hypothetical protein
MADMILALHGDFATADMLCRDMGDLRHSIDLFYDARGWTRFDHRIDKLLRIIEKITEPLILVGYSRGGSAIARLSELVEIAAAVVYESPVIDSEGVGGSFPVLQVWNDRGARFGSNELRRGQAIIAEQIWGERHDVTQLIGSGRHWQIRPPAHCWDCKLNDQIREWMSQYDSRTTTAD